MDMNYEGLVPVLRNLLGYCTEHPDIMKEGEPLTLFSLVPIQDECAEIGIIRKDGIFTFYFRGSYFSVNHPLKGSPENVIDQLRGLKVITTPEDVITRFKEAAQKPLGNYLAKKELKGLERELLN